MLLGNLTLALLIVLAAGVDRVDNWDLFWEVVLGVDGDVGRLALQLEGLVLLDAQGLVDYYVTALGGLRFVGELTNICLFG